MTTANDPPGDAPDADPPEIGAESATPDATGAPMVAKKRIARKRTTKKRVAKRRATKKQAPAVTGTSPDTASDTTAGTVASGDTAMMSSSASRPAAPVNSGDQEQPAGARSQGDAAEDPGGSGDTVAQTAGQTRREEQWLTAQSEGSNSAREEQRANEEPDGSVPSQPAPTEPEKPGAAAQQGYALNLIEAARAEGGTAHHRPLGSPVSPVASTDGTGHDAAQVLLQRLGQELVPRVVRPRGPGIVHGMNPFIGQSDPAAAAGRQGAAPAPRRDSNPDPAFEAGQATSAAAFKAEHEHARSGGGTVDRMDNESSDMSNGRADEPADPQQRSIDDTLEDFERALNEVASLNDDSRQTTNPGAPVAEEYPADEPNDAQPPNNRLEAVAVEDLGIGIANAIGDGFFHAVRGGRLAANSVAGGIHGLADGLQGSVGHLRSGIKRLLP